MQLRGEARTRNSLVALTRLLQQHLHDLALHVLLHLCLRVPPAPPAPASARRVSNRGRGEPWPEAVHTKHTGSRRRASHLAASRSQRRVLSHRSTTTKSNQLRPVPRRTLAQLSRRICTGASQMCNTWLACLLGAVARRVASLAVCFSLPGGAGFPTAGTNETATDRSGKKSQLW